MRKHSQESLSTSGHAAPVLAAKFSIHLFYQHDLNEGVKVPQSQPFKETAHTGTIS